MEELNKINIIVIGPQTKKILQGYGFKSELGFLPKSLIRNIRHRK